MIAAAQPLDCCAATLSSTPAADVLRSMMPTQPASL